MDRRQFLRDTATLAAAGVVAPQALGAEKQEHPSQGAQEPAAAADGKLITSAPMLQNYAPDSIGIAFSVSDMANGYAKISRYPDMREARTVKCGGYRITDVNDKVMLVRVTGLAPATKYYYRIGADHISYKGGYDMKILGNEEDPRVYSFTTAGKDVPAHFCVINDTHAKFDAFSATQDLVARLAPGCVIWNGDATNVEESIESQIKIFLQPPIARPDYASEIPYLFCPGNHDSRGMANRHIDRVLMFRQPEERLSRDWDLGRNFAVRMGDVALIGLDTAEDKLDTNPIFAGLFNSGDYRKAQVAWLENALKRKEIAKAPFLVAFCHIPLFDPDPKMNPGDVAPADKDPQYTHDFAMWQRTCANLWTPLLQKAGCQLIITAHQHKYRFDAPDGTRKWAQMIGGGPNLDNATSFPTVIDGRVEGKRLVVRAYNVKTGAVLDEHSFSSK